MVPLWIGYVMCVMCPDYVDTCYECKPFKGRNDRDVYPQFYLEMSDGGFFCEHLSKKHGTQSPSMYEHVRTEHTWELESWVDKNENPLICADRCVEESWWTVMELKNVVDALRKEEYDETSSTN